MFIFVHGNTVKGQSFPPGAGFSGSTAIHCDSSVFTDWAVTSTITRGYQNITNPDNGFTEFGEINNAIGKADGNSGVISLGDGGSAVLTFHFPIVNGEGFDFAVFENGFFPDNTSELAFLELAFVEVSTDGIEYVRFPSVSEIQTQTQINAYENINARMISNLAGKYTVFYGTPFDLEDITELIDETSVDPNNINYIKIIDVIGCINDNSASYDSEGNIINDPFPTPFASGGFDLDAVGVINNTMNNYDQSELFIIQNPVNNRLIFQSDLEHIEMIEIISFSGQSIKSYYSNMDIDVGFLKHGLYFLKITSNSKSYTKKFMKF
jgi:hypothetical protein